MGQKLAGVASDSADLDEIASSVVVETSGYVKMTLTGGSVIEVLLNPGKWDFRIKRLWATPAGTPAAGGVQPFV
jgi:hypothetical protein